MPMTFADLSLGQRADFEVEVSPHDLDRFAELSGDTSALHMDREFARQRGFPDRVVHGAYLAALVSRLVGVHLPGQNCLLHGLSLQFKSAVAVGVRVRVEGVVDQLSAAVEVAVLKVSITDVATGSTVATAKVQLGFTRDQPGGIQA